MTGDEGIGEQCVSFAVLPDGTHVIQVAAVQLMASAGHRRHLLLMEIAVGVRVVWVARVERCVADKMEYLRVGHCEYPFAERHVRHPRFRSRKENDMPVKIGRAHV